MVVQASTSLPRGMWVQRFRQSTWLSANLRITVAGQRRTHTGFAFMPSHPGVGRLDRLLSTGFNVPEISIIEETI